MGDAVKKMRNALLVLPPEKRNGERLAKKSEKEMKKAGLSLEDLLNDLEKQRERYIRERYWR